MTTIATAPTADEAVAATRPWIERAVIGLNLCPFAKAVYVRNLVHFVVSAATTVDVLRDDLERELLWLDHADPDLVDNTLLIHPHVLGDFLDYNDFLGVADELLDHLDLVGVLQIASFHPDYRFADRAPDDITNYTNRSPYAMLHLLRESSIDIAVAAFPETGQIYQKNIRTLRGLGIEGWKALGVDGRDDGGQ